MCSITSYFSKYAHFHFAIRARKSECLTARLVTKAIHFLGNNLSKPEALRVLLTQHRSLSNSNCPESITTVKMLASREFLPRARQIAFACHRTFCSSPQRLQHTTSPLLNDHRASSLQTEKYDLLIIGAGAAGLCAALRAHSRGLRPLVVEKSSKIGGASAYSGGGVWIPNNHVSKAAGVPDSVSNALKYLEHLIGDAGPVSSKQRKMAFLTKGPEMVAFLEGIGFKWRCARGYPDYYPDQPGGNIGRTIEGDIFDLKSLGDWEKYLLLKPDDIGFAGHCDEYRHIPIFKRTFKSFWMFIKIGLFRSLGRKLLGQRPATFGKSLVAQLMFLSKNRRIAIWRQSPLVKLLVENDRVVGALVDGEGTLTSIRAEKGVLLCAGGFARNLEMRQKHAQEPASNKWTMVPSGDTGDAVQAGQNVGAELALMDDAWWGPVFVNPLTGENWFALAERSLPHSIIVDSEGQRFMNESQNYTDCGHAQYNRHKLVPAIPAWFIFDSQHRNKYMLWTFLPGKTPKSSFSSGFITTAETIQDLAAKIGVNEEGLKTTVSHFNEMAARGIDDDFGRGRTAYDNFLGDPTCKPNPNLGPLNKGPFFAIRVWPGDLGTKGGLLTDENARVVGKDGKPIQGLYAAGNTSASVMGRTYPGAGATIGPALTFAFIAADHIAEG